MTITDWLDQAQARADAVEAGEWTVIQIGRGARVLDASGFAVPGCFNCGENDAVYELPDAEFIAAAGTDLPASVAALRAVIDLHRPVSWQQANPETGEMDEDWSLSHPLPPFCRECTFGFYVAAVENGDQIPQDADVSSFPCPTVRAIAAALGVTP